MPWPENHIPRYRKHRKSGQALVTIRGKDHYLGPHDTKASKTLYDRLIAEYLAGGRPGATDEEDDRLTVNELMAAYWRHCRVYYVKGGQPSSEQALIKHVLKDLRHLYGESTAAEFGPLALKALRQTWIDRGHARRTINNNVSRIVRMFRWATAEELLPPSVHQALSAVPGLKRGRTKAHEPPPIPPVAIDVVEKTMPHLSPVVRAMIRVQLLTGMRPAEVCKLCPGDIDRTDEVWQYAVGGHKTEHHGKRRTVFIGPAAQQVLLPYLLRDPAARCFTPEESDAAVRDRREQERRTPPSCGNRRGTNRKKKPLRAPGGQYTTAAYGRAIARACRLAFPPPEPLRKRDDESFCVVCESLRRDCDPSHFAMVPWAIDHRGRAITSAEAGGWTAGTRPGRLAMDATARMGPFTPANLASPGPGHDNHNRKRG